MNDLDLLVVTQIAYYDFDPVILQNMKEMPVLRELMAATPMIRQKLENALAQVRAKADKYKIYRAEHAMSLYEKIMAPDSIYGGWKLITVKNENTSTGFYGCLLEISEDTAVVGFRGSESTDKLQVEKDWIDADLGLLNAASTQQQTSAAAFIAEIDQCYDYENYYISGHSLGGNLAAHAAVTASDGMKEKVSRCISFDGPGFSREYLQMNEQRITGIKDKVVRYQWSLVGNLLFWLPECRSVSVAVDELVDDNYDVEALLQKHDTGFVKFSDEGSVILGTMERFARQVGEMTRSIDGCPAWIGHFAVSLIDDLVKMSDKDRTIKGAKLIGKLAAVAIRFPAEAAVSMLVVGAFIIIGHVDKNFFGKKLIPLLCKGISGSVHAEEVISCTLKQSLVHAANVTEMRVGEAEQLVASAIKNII